MFLNIKGNILFLSCENNHEKSNVFLLLFKKKCYPSQPLFFKGLGTKGNKVTKYTIILYIYIITRF